jgi:hypothetical protein
MNAAALRLSIGAALDRALEESLAQPWQWAERDCAHWAANVLRDPLGFDPCEAFRGRYRTALGYVRVLRHDGFASLLEAIEAVAGERGWTEIRPADAAKGDVGVTRLSADRNAVFTRAAVLNVSPAFWAGFRSYGYGAIPTPAIERAWSVA